MLRNEDQKSAVRSLREYLETVKQKRLPKDSVTATSSETATKEKDPSRTNLTPVPVTGSSLTPGLTTISEASQGDEESQGPPKLQRLASEENPSASNVVSASSTTATTSSTATNEVGGDVGGAEEGGVVTTKGQDVVGGVFPNSTALPSTPHSAGTVSQLEPSNLLIAKRSDTAPPAATPVHQVNHAPSEPPTSSGVQNALAATSQSNIHVSSDHSQNAALSEDERKTTVRTNSNESEKGSQSQASISSLDEKQSVVAEGVPQAQKEASLPPSNSSSVQTAPSRSLVIPVGPVEGGGVGSGGMSRAGSEDGGATTTPTSVSTAAPMLQPHELGVVQSEHSTESTPTHISQGGLESTSTSTISSQEQLPQEGKSDKEKGTNGTLKKKGQRAKQKQIKLNLVETTDEKVVKCALVTGTGQMVNFQFSIKYDKPLAIFQKLVRLYHACISDDIEEPLYCEHPWDS